MSSDLQDKVITVDRGLREVAIRVSNLSKVYQIYDHPADRLKQFVFPKLRKLAGLHSRPSYTEFWALRGVSFDVRKGETVGIIGNNGAGKSTLLQIICGTLNPSHGSVEINGRVAALLELGSGFNPEFTGRENVHLYASVIGLTKEEIDERYDKILAFADIGEFINQPVKTYSSGMTVRLAFAVIAHVDADILIIDEALAVGDAIFTQKCMRFIRSFMEKGTVLFVSHDMASVSNLCSLGIWLERGSVRQIASAQEVAQAYLRNTLQYVYGDKAYLHDANSSDSRVSAIPVEQDSQKSEEDIKKRPFISYHGQFDAKDNLSNAQGFKTDQAELVKIEIVNLNNRNQSVMQGGEMVKVNVKARAIIDLDQPILGFALNDKLGQTLFGENTLPLSKRSPLFVAAGQFFEANFTFRLPMLPNGEYALFASVANGTLYDNVQHHLLHDAMIVTVSSSQVRWGLVGIWFENIEFGLCN